MAELEYVCANCGSPRLKYVEGESGTGVYSPDGEQERRYWEAMLCLNCGKKEEI